MTPREANLSVRQMAEALNDLPGFRLTLLRREYQESQAGGTETPWIAHVDADKADGHMLAGFCGRGSTPDDAITALWEQVSDVPSSMWVATRGPNRRDLRWTGFMWRDVNRNYPEVVDA